MREKHELVQLCFTRAEDDDLTITLFKMLSDDAVDAIRILERAAQLLVFLDELGMFLLFAYLVDGDLPRVSFARWLSRQEGSRCPTLLTGIVSLPQ